MRPEPSRPPPDTPPRRPTAGRTGRRRGAVIHRTGSGDPVLTDYGWHPSARDEFRARSGQARGSGSPGPSMTSRPSVCLKGITRRRAGSGLPHPHGGRGSPADATAISTSRARLRALPFSKGVTGGRSPRTSWRRWVSVPPTGIYSAQRGRGPSRLTVSL